MEFLIPVASGSSTKFSSISWVFPSSSKQVEDSRGTSDIDKILSFIRVFISTSFSSISDDSGGGAEGIIPWSELWVFCDGGEVSFDDIWVVKPIWWPKSDVAKNETGDVVTGTSQ